MFCATEPLAGPSVTSVLILEADEYVARVAAARFQGLGARAARVARTAQEARAMIQSGRFDFAILDVVTAGIDMEGVVRALEGCDIPFVFSAEAMAGIAGMAPEGKRYAWIRIVAKPYSDSDLIEAMDAALARQDLTLTL